MNLRLHFPAQAAAPQHCCSPQGFTYSSGRCSEGVGLRCWHLLGGARPGFMAGVVGKRLLLPLYNFKQEEKPNVAVLHSQGLLHKHRGHCCHLGRAGGRKVPLVPGLPRAFCKEASLPLAEPHDGSRQSFSASSPKDKQNPCRKHQRGVANSELCFPSGTAPPLQNLGRAAGHGHGSQHRSPPGARGELHCMVVLQLPMLLARFCLPQQKPFLHGELGLLPNKKPAAELKASSATPTQAGSWHPDKCSPLCDTCWCP